MCCNIDALCFTLYESNHFLKVCPHNFISLILEIGSSITKTNSIYLDNNMGKWVVGCNL